MAFWESLNLRVYTFVLRIEAKFYSGISNFEFTLVYCFIAHCSVLFVYVHFLPLDACLARFLFTEFRKIKFLFFFVLYIRILLLHFFWLQKNLSEGYVYAQYQTFTVRTHCAQYTVHNTHAKNNQNSGQIFLSTVLFGMHAKTCQKVNLSTYEYSYRVHVRYFFDWKAGRIKLCNFWQEKTNCLDIFLLEK